MRRASIAGLLIALAGLGGLPATAAAQATGPGCTPAWPVVAYRAGGATVTLPPSAPPPISCGVQTGYPSSESSLAVAGDDALIYSPANTENSMARSPDGGASWNLTYPAAEQPTSFWNTVDPYVVADRRTGWVFWSHATGPVRNEGGLPQGSGFLLAAAYGFQVYTSRDDGLSWSTADYSTAPTGDWEKLSVGPAPPASTGAAQPTGYPGVVYLCANSPVEVAGPGRLCYKSLDGGTTFTPAGYISPSVGQPQDVCPPLNFNPGVVNSRGVFFTPADCQDSAYVVISRDEGSSYTWVPLPGAPTSGPDGGPEVSLAVDDADNLYALWLANDKLYLTVSKDDAKTWSPPMEVTAPGVTGIDHPALAAGAPGHVAITYYGSQTPSAQMLSAYITQTNDALDAQPLFYGAPFNDPAHPIYHDYGLTGASPRVDFIGGEFDPAGTTFWSGAVEQFGTPDANNDINTTGYVGRLDFTPTTPAVVSTPGTTVAEPGGVSLTSHRACVATKRLVFHINRVPGGRVVRATVRVNGRLVLIRRGRDLRRIGFARPRGGRLVIEIVTTNNEGGQVVTLRTLTGCTRTPVRGHTHRHRPKKKRRSR